MRKDTDAPNLFSLYVKQFTKKKLRNLAAEVTSLKNSRKYFLDLVWFINVSVFCLTKAYFRKVYFDRNLKL